MRKIIVFILALAAAAVAGRGRPLPPAKPQTAIFAGGCFWSMQSAFEKVYGVIDGRLRVHRGHDAATRTTTPTRRHGHVEAVQVIVGPQQGDATASCWTPTGTTPIPRTPVGSSSTGGRSTGPSCSHERPAEGRGGSLQGRAGEVRQVRRAHRRGDPEGGAILRGGGLPPGLPEEEPRTTTSPTTRTRGAPSSSPRSGAPSALVDPAAPPRRSRGRGPSPARTSSRRRSPPCSST